VKNFVFSIRLICISLYPLREAHARYFKTPYRDTLASRNDEADPDPPTPKISARNTHQEQRADPAVEAELERVKKELDDLEDENESLRSEVKKLQQELRSLGSLSLRTEDIRKKFREQERALQQKVDQFEKEAHQLNLDKRQLQQQVRDAQRGADSATRDSLRYHEETQRIRELLEKSTDTIKKENEAKRKLQEELSVLKSKVNDLESDLSRLNRERSRGQQVQQVESTHNQELENAQREKAEKLTKEVSQLQTQIHALQRDEASKTREIEHFQADAQTHKASLRRLEEQLDQTKTDLRKDGEARKKLDEDLRQVTSQLQRLQEDKAMMQRELDVRRAEVETRQREVSRLNEENLRMKTEIQQLKRTADNAARDASAGVVHQHNEERLHEELNQARDEKHKLQESVDKMQHEHRLWEQEKARLQRELDEAKTNNAAEIKKISDSLEAAKKESQSLRSVQDMNAKLMKELTEAGNNLKHALDEKKKQENHVATMKKELEELKAAASSSNGKPPAVDDNAAILTATQAEVSSLKQKVSELQVQLSKETKAKEESTMLLKRLQKAKVPGAPASPDSANASPPPELASLKKELEELSKEKVRAEELAKKLEQVTKEKDELAKKVVEQDKTKAAGPAAAAPVIPDLSKQLEQLAAEKARSNELEEANAVLKRQASEWRSKFQLVRTISTDGRKKPMKRDNSADALAPRQVSAPQPPPDAYTAKIIKIQAVGRGLLARINFKSSKYRKNVATEIYETERAYVSTLEALVRTYVAPLRHMISLGEPIISNDDISFVFSNVDLLHAGNKKLLEGLDQRLKRWHANQTLADVFITAMKDDYLKPHVPFIQNFTKSSEARARLIQSVPLFSTFVKLCRGMPGVEGKSLDDLLITPVQRLPRYKLLLTDLQKRTPRSHPDYSNVTRAITEIDEFTSFINENNRRVDELNSLSSRLAGLEQLDSNPDRKLIMEGKLALIQGKEQKRRYVLLFNDCIVFAKDSRRKRLSLAKDPASAALKVVFSLKLTSKTVAENIPVFDGKRMCLLPPPPFIGVPVSHTLILTLLQPRLLCSVSPSGTVSRTNSSLPPRRRKTSGLTRLCPQFLVLS
jgi:predicted  nucleic acid-binding Zn-ribbon protein